MKTGIAIVFLASGALFGQATADFVGSQTCRTCHAEIFNRWSKTRMANVVQDPKLHPEPEVEHEHVSQARTQRHATGRPLSHGSSGDIKVV